MSPAWTYIGEVLPFIGSSSSSGVLVCSVLAPKKIYGTRVRDGCS